MRPKSLIPAVAVLAMMTWAVSAQALTFPLPPQDVDIVGEVRTVKAARDETLLDIGRRHGLGYEEMRRANPEVDIWFPGEGAEIVLPTRFVLPDAPREGIVLNVAEMRLYYYPQPGEGESAVVESYPVSIGRQDWQTPLGTTRITEKEENPWWYPPESIKREAADDGRSLPDAVPPGPDNPLGDHKIRLAIPGYLIHGTNRPWGVGMRVTHGCVRMYPEDIEGLFPRVAVNTSVRIVNQPVKAGWAAGELYLQVHPLLDEQREAGVSTFEPAVEAVASAMARHGGGRVDHERVRAALERPDGIPVVISRGGLAEDLLSLAD